MSAAGAGASAVNNIKIGDSAYIDGDNADGSTQTGIEAANVSVTGNDTSTITANVGTGAISASFGAVGVAVSVGVSLATNNVADTMDVYVANASLTASLTSYETGVAGGQNATVVSLKPGDTVLLGNSFGGAAYSGPLQTIGSGSQAATVDPGDIVQNGSSVYRYMGAAATQFDLSGLTPTFTAASGLESLAQGVLVADANGNVYRYVGPGGDDNVSVKPGEFVQVGGAYYEYVGLLAQTFDLTGAANTNPDNSSPNFSDTTVWTPGATPPTGAVIYPYGALVNLSTTAFSNPTLWQFVAVAAPNFADASAWSPYPGTAGATYRYVGAPGSVNLGAQDYTDTSKWVQVGFVTAAAPGTSPLNVALQAGDTVTDAAGDAFEYVGPSQTLDINSQNYANTALWAPTGFVKVAATELATINASGEAAAVALSGGVVGVSVSGAGVNVANTILGDTEAYLPTARSPRRAPYPPPPPIRR